MDTNLPRRALGALLLLPALAPRAQASGAAVAAVPGGFADLVERVGPAVVRIAALERVAATRPPGQPRGPLRRAIGQGSGFLISADGLLVTNHHVAGEAEQIAVQLADQTELRARLVGSDPYTDLALLKLDAPRPLPFVNFSDATPRIGDPVLAIGNPFGLGVTATAGIISARGREIGAGPYDDFLQTDAAINPGNSGGPLFAMDGRVAGVTTAIFSPTGASVGIGFAIPASTAMRVIAELRAHGRVERGWLGVVLAPPQANEIGVRIAELVPGGPAQRAGLRPGDMILALDDDTVESGRELARDIAGRAPGSEVRLAISRGGEGRTLRAVVAPLPPPPPQRG